MSSGFGGRETADSYYRHKELTKQKLHGGAFSFDEITETFLLDFDEKEENQIMFFPGTNVEEEVASESGLQESFDLTET